MFHQVKVFDAKGKLKQVIPPEELTVRHWNIFRKKKNGVRLGMTQGKKQKPVEIKE